MTIAITLERGRLARNFVKSVHGRIIPCCSLIFAMRFRLGLYLAASYNAQTHARTGRIFSAPCYFP